MRIHLIYHLKIGIPRMMRVGLPYSFLENLHFLHKVELINCINSMGSNMALNLLNISNITRGLKLKD